MARRLRFVATASLAAALVLPACGRKGAHDDRSSESANRSDTSVCAILAVPLEDTTGGLTFADLIEQPAASKDLLGTAAAVALLRLRYRDDVGPYQPVIEYLAEYGRVDGGERGTAPKVTNEVRASAKELDRALADGLCK